MFKVPGYKGSYHLTTSGAVAKYQDHRNPEFSEKLKKQNLEALAFLATPFLPQEVAAGEKAINPKMLEDISVNEAPPAARSVVRPR